MYYNDQFLEEKSQGEFTYLTPKEVMQELCIGRNTFYRLVNSGALKAFRIGKLWRVRRDDLDTFGGEHYL